MVAGDNLRREIFVRNNGEGHECLAVREQHARNALEDAGRKSLEKKSGSVVRHRKVEVSWSAWLTAWLGSMFVDGTGAKKGRPCLRWRTAVTAVGGCHAGGCKAEASDIVAQLLSWRCR
eukprot:gb/GEZJ01001485.1/.p4 GENE.gb/GEZJ01001485.1/~~gb/GEZJ01001485.1/.p4  ORF type:complete len:119 (+),score=3.94 gb/GEZJ01001485.1/:2061-2417(+)